MIEQITVTAKRESNGKLRITTTTEEIVNQILSDDSNIGDALNAIMANAVWSEENPVNSEVTNLYGIQ